MHREQPQATPIQTARKLRHLHLGAIIDAQGREIPITEQMILQACRQLEKDSQPRRRLFG
ncbi:hypothetical protein E5198_11410 [Pseudomonas sp. A-1]|jgi:hypothetical protein|uniref:PA1571 family protein n=1 Tax=unclassified Pseudomonas TaxID=196821 RepID=UPI0010A5FF02|nr:MULTISPECIES: PA1571 family protein [unclassified Pseudomonas]THG81808.1 hypothetical protein E5198_11410 [Pseudomonas sp. A-1]WPP47329.1 hypothetical protein SK095_08130 [Pseudomonas sp. AN-1]